MAYVMTNKAFANKAIDISKNYKTLYVVGAFGAPALPKNKTRYTTGKYLDTNNAKEPRKSKILNASADTFFFDCTGLIKAILWGWSGNKNATYGGAEYCKDGIPDFEPNGMIARCSEVSTNFKDIEVGEVLWLKDHAGIYIGNGLAVESAPAWQSKVQITAVGNIGAKAGYNSRKWTKHGKLPWVEYKVEPTPTPTPTPTKISINTPPTIKVGSKGGTVKVWQQIMVNNGISVGSYGIDGDFGSATKSATIAFQKKVGLPETGEVNSNTWIVGLNTL